MWESCVENEEIKKKKTIRKVKDINIYALTENWEKTEVQPLHWSDRAVGWKRKPWGEFLSKDTQPDG